MNELPAFFSDDELASAQTNAQALPELTEVSQGVIALAAKVPPAIRPGVEQLALGAFAMFLKTILTDLRAVQVLIGVGYPFSAATVASSLWEKSLLGRFILRDPAARLEKYLEHPSKKTLPWKIRRMLAELVEEPDPALNARAVEVCHLQYTLLCSLKHPQAGTLATSSHAHLDVERPMELHPASAEKMKGVNQLILTQALYSTLEFLAATLPVFCQGGLVEEARQLTDRLGEYCLSERGTPHIPEELHLPPTDFSLDAYHALVNSRKQ